MKETDWRVSGFRAGAVAAGLKKHGGLDLGLIVSDEPAAVAGVFTTNRVCAAPVLLCRERIQGGAARAVVANAGCANACTGPQGLEDARSTAAIAAGALETAPEDVLVASTGVIGARLDMEKLKKAVPRVAGDVSEDGLPQFAEAILTTDTFPKMSRFDATADGKPYRIVGVAKGAGMIMPDMATMLSFVLTDAAIPPQDLKKALFHAADATFNRITVDGDTSTNDTLLALANGAAGTGNLSGPDLDAFQEGLQQVMEVLAVMIVRDGEGATRVIFVQVRGASGPEDAISAARTVANSNLVKTAVCGRDPNWGRIMAALGRSGVLMQEEAVSIWIDDVLIVEGGLGRGPDAESAAAALMAEREEITLTIDLHQGKYEDRVVTCDLTQRYVDINADYRT
jgi:glutamate N-acetyltransferase / amino-acid N-acetyltransferase